MFGATIGEAMAGLLCWLVGWRSWEAAATDLLLLWRRLLRRASPGDTAPWSELPPELLGVVLLRLPSQADRVHLRAVCRPWRSAPRLQPLPPPFPRIVLRDHTFLTLPDGALHRLPRHRCCIEIAVRVSTGSTLFLGHLDGRCCLVNPFSRKTTLLKNNLASYSPVGIQKVVLSDHVVAFLIKGKLYIFPRHPRPGERGRQITLTVQFDITAVVDIAVFQGNLFVLTRKYNREQKPELHLLDINDEQGHVRSVQCIPAEHPLRLNAIGTRRLFFFYLVASGDRLLMVERQIDMDLPLSLNCKRRPRPLQTRFEVWEAADMIGGQLGRWSRVDRLMGRALFVGRECSGSLPAQCGAQEDCVYFMTERGDHLLPIRERKPQDDLLDCVVYNVRDRTVKPLPSEIVAARDGPWKPAWLFPSDV
ncbi:unnamed protein product [Alopecurus aequalis]